MYQNPQSSYVVSNSANFNSNNRYSSSYAAPSYQVNSSYSHMDTAASHQTQNPCFQSNYAKSPNPLAQVSSPVAVKAVQFGESKSTGGVQEKLYTMLQKKARNSYKRLQKTQGNIQNHNMAFFYIQNTMAA